jgi:hypothetical protein
VLPEHVLKQVVVLRCSDVESLRQLGVRVAGVVRLASLVKETCAASGLSASSDVSPNSCPASPSSKSSSSLSATTRNLSDRFDREFCSQGALRGDAEAAAAEPYAWQSNGPAHQRKAKEKRLDCHDDLARGRPQGGGGAALGPAKAIFWGLKKA